VNGAPLIEAAGARIAIAGATAVPALDLVTRGARVLLLGAARPLVAALTGVWATEGDDEPSTVAVVGGSLRLFGADVASGAHRALAGAAPLDPPLPPRWSVMEYVTWAARLSGRSRREGAVLAEAALARMALAGSSRRRLATLARVERRALVLAAAIALDPPAIVVEDPFDGLEAAEAPLMLGGLGRALEGRAAVISTSCVRLTHPSVEVARGATDVCLFRDGALVLHADVAALLGESRVFELTLGRNAERLRAAAGDNGWHIEGGPTHYALRLPKDLGPTDVLRAAAAAGAAVLRCVPLVG
jgi:ABC-2 type transport system ATP-binding protein